MFSKKLGGTVVGSPELGLKRNHYSLVFCCVVENCVMLKPFELGPMKCLSSLVLYLFGFFCVVLNYIIINYVEAS